MRPSNRHYRPGFTIIEVMVATTIIGIIAASAGLSFLKTRLNARNSQRKEVAQTYTKAVSAYSASTGTSFVTASAQKSGCSAAPFSNVTATNNVPSATESPGNSECVGAAGRGFGMLNLESGTTTESNLSSDLSSLGFGNTTNFTYGSGGSILSALKALGYVNTVSTDPSAHLVDGKIATTDPDYLLVRCCKDGRQAVGSGGSLFAVWAKLEPGGSADFSIADANSQHACGGPKVAPPAFGSPDGTAGSAPNYHYLFGATGPVTGQLTGSHGPDVYAPSWFAVGNAPVQNLTSLSDNCDRNA